MDQKEGAVSAGVLREAAGRMRALADAIEGDWRWSIESPLDAHVAAWSPDVARAVASLIGMAGDHAKGQGKQWCPSCVDQAEDVAPRLPC